MNTPRISDLLLERYALGEVTDSERERVEAALADDAALRDRLQTVKDTDAAIRAAHPPGRVAAAIHARVEVGPRPRWALGGLVMAGAAAVALAVTMVGREAARPGIDFPSPDRSTVAAPTERSKGLTPALRLYRQRGNHNERLRDGDVARAGDLLQLTYVAAGHSWGVLVSLDGAGVVTLHHPANDAASSRLEPDGEIALDHAYELDEAPDFERFVLVASDEPIAVDAVLSAARTLAGDPERAKNDRLALEGHPSEVSVTIVKREKP